MIKACDVQINYKEIEEMIETVDRNGDGRISYSEFRQDDNNNNNNNNNSNNSNNNDYRFIED